MSQPISQERINRSFADQVRKLSAENAQLKQTIAQRSVDITTAFIDGMDVLLDQARQGNPAARMVLDKLSKQLKALDASALGIVVANGTQPG